METRSEIDRSGPKYYRRDVAISPPCGGPITHVSLGPQPGGHHQALFSRLERDLIACLPYYRRASVKSTPTTALVSLFLREGLASGGAAPASSPSHLPRDSRPLQS